MTLNSINILSSATMPTRWGVFQMSVFSWCDDGKEHLALVHGDIGENMLVRIHSECLTGDLFSSLRCDCGAQLHFALDLICKAGSGIVVYLRQEGRGIGLVEKLKAYVLQDEGLDTVDANVKLGHPVDARNFMIATDLLKQFGMHSVKLITNNPMKTQALIEAGIYVTERIECNVPTRSILGEKYLQTKRAKLGHFIPKP